MKPLIRRILKEQVDYSNFCLPINGWAGTLSSGQQFKTTGNRSGHNGVVLANDSGSNLYAPEDGTIEEAKFHKPYDYSHDKTWNESNGWNACGGYIRINHANNIDTKYCHLKQIDVGVGNTVTRGQVIGKTGGDSAANSPSSVADKGRGNSSASHLHYEVLLNRSQINPEPDFLRNGECGGAVTVSPTLTGCTVGDCENGVGTYVWADGDKYIGEFKDGQMNGQGTMYYTNGDKYEGDFTDGQGTGHGTYTMTNGNKYTGEHLEYFFTGKGTMVYADGGIYVGEWLDDDRHGQGKMTHADGTIEEGPWEEDVFIGSTSQQQDSTPDTPFTNEDRTYNMSIQKVLQMKKFLDIGYVIEGIMDEETIKAIKAVQKAASLPVNGMFDKPTALALTSNRYFGDKN
jgi:hypothetical protein